MSEHDEPPAGDPAEAQEAPVEGPAVEVVDDAPPQVDELQALQGQLARARADYVNLEKRVEREAAAQRDRVKARVLEGFLQVFEYALMAKTEAEKQPGALSEGVKMVVREFERLLEDQGVKTLGAVGEAFDAKHHEAVAEEDSDMAPHHIVRVVQTGYMLGERVLRHAKVVVSTDVGQDQE